MATRTDPAVNGCETPVSHDTLPPLYAELTAVLDRLPYLLRETRRRNRQSLRDAASEIGVPFTSYARWEKDDSHPDTKVIPTLLRWVAASTAGADPAATGSKAL